MLPDAGGSYTYVREAFGPLPAFLLGWTLFLAINTGSAATLAVAFANYLGELVPLTPLAHNLAGVAMIAAVAAVEIPGARDPAPPPDLGTAPHGGAVPPPPGGRPPLGARLPPSGPPAVPAPP